MCCYFTAHSHLKELYTDGNLVIAGLYMGDSNRWSIPEVLERKKGFALEFEQQLENKEPITIKVSDLYVYGTKVFISHHLSINLFWLVSGLYAHAALLP